MPKNNIPECCSFIAINNSIWPPENKMLPIPVLDGCRCVNDSPFLILYCSLTVKLPFGENKPILSAILPPLWVCYSP